MARYIVICIGFVLVAGAAICGAETRPEELIRAIENGDVNQVKALLAKGADVNAKTEHGDVALTAAAGNCLTNQFDMVVLLLGAGADANVKDGTGKTALLKAVWCGRSHHNIIRSLLVSGADANAKDREGATALMYAAYFGEFPVVKLLVEHDADVGVSAGGRTALSIARQEGRTEVVKFLQEAERQHAVRAKEAATEAPESLGGEPGHGDASEDKKTGKSGVMTPDDFGRELFEVLKNKNYGSIDRYLWQDRDWAYLAELGHSITEEQRKEMETRIREKLHEGITQYHEQYFKAETSPHSVEYLRFVPGRARQVTPEYMQYNDSHLHIRINGTMDRSLEIDHIQVIKGEWRISEIK